MTRFKDLVDLGLTDDEATLLTTPLADMDGELLSLAFQVNEKRFGLIREKNEKFVPKPVAAGSYYIISDDLGINGVLNPADGKTYSSKSAYYAAIKSKGLEIMGNDAPTQRATPKTESINWEKAVAETLRTSP